MLHIETVLRQEVYTAVRTANTHIERAQLFD